MKMDAKGQLVPDLADGYTISDDKKTYTFQLKDNLRWHDGEPLTAEDVVYTLTVVQDPELKSPLRLNFSGVKVEALNDTTIKIQLTQAYAPFINSLTVGIIPKHIWYSIPASNAPLAEAMTKPIGSGPYKFKSLTKDSKSGSIKFYTLEANKQYYQHPAYISELNFKFYPDFNSGVEALKNQNIDGLSLLPKDSALQTAISKQTHILNLIVPQYTAVFINPDNNPVLKDLKVRQALAYALDREQLLKDSNNEQSSVINSPILPGMLGYDANVKSYDFQTDTSRQLLDQAGYKVKDGDSFRFDKDDKALELTLTTVDQPETIAVANLIKKYWEAVGVKTNVEIINRGSIRKDVIEPRSYQLLLFGQVIGPSQDPYPFWHSSQTKNPGLNLSIMANRDIDAALDKARTSTSEQTKIEQYKIFQNKLQEQVFAFFLYNPSYSYPVAKNLKGTEQLTRINIPAERFADITNWYLKTSRSWSN
jgi:peptide/nickel transport system substrate-binding protein